MEHYECKVGLQVTFGLTHGEKSLGKIVKVNAKKCKVELLESRGSTSKAGSLWNVPASLMTPVVRGMLSPFPMPADHVAKVDKIIGDIVYGTTPKRSREVVIREIHITLSALSPENLHCDNEISRPAAAKKGRALRTRLKALYEELDRTVMPMRPFKHTRG